MTFDRVLPNLLSLCMEHGASRSAERLGVVRDVRGRVRLVVQPYAGTDPMWMEIEQVLKKGLGPYFVPPVLLASGTGEHQQLAKNLLDQARKTRWPHGWPTSYETPLGMVEKLEGCDTVWFGIERTIGKDAWLSVPSKPPWPLISDKTPPIVTFHSFKGGVGRSTLLASYAISAAAQNRRVAVVDLDLEAPGVGSLLGATTTRGVLDILVDHLVTGKIDLQDATGKADLRHDLGERITVLPAGPLDKHFLAKLARLDFATVRPGEPSVVADAVRALLLSLKPQFDLILLDARAGLHDLSGMAVQALSHVNALVFRGSEQHLLGLEATFDVLGIEPQARLVLVETMLPARVEETAQWRQKTQERVHDLMCRLVYEDPPPQLEDQDAGHRISHVTRKEWLEALDAFSGLTDHVLADAELRAVSERIDGVCGLAAEDQGTEVENEEDTDGS